MSKDLCITAIVFCVVGIIFYIVRCFLPMPILTVSDYIGSAIILLFTSVPFVFYYFRYFYKKKNKELENGEEK